MRGPGGRAPPSAEPWRDLPGAGLEKNTSCSPAFFVFLGSKHASRLRTLLEERGAVVGMTSRCPRGTTGFSGRPGSGKEVFPQAGEGACSESKA